ncbi:MAG: hypothetical protein J0L70_24720 [Leptolyngbya sp. UWPOB_LEPTO1]|uniref:hypothetical protein n=1 Tax=Leptolyngbya sp. UWPOB_LEPTO1 TaxID=2815653 RepID=UPI001AD3327B|nr:hypothetical protein [Leptolyngbya sp. UWPOB_LEPTO1]MBN8563744.1 hypothetical protein [Leptolyngbya sp. UWPOB_LEPTO1]
MVWRTNLGERILQGTEAEVYLTAVQHLIEHLEDSRDFDEIEVKTGDRIFDNANINQKIVLLHTCLIALLNPAISAPPLTNVTEAAAYYPFAFLKLRVGDEIMMGKEEWSEEDEEIKFYYRHLIWKAFEQHLLPAWQAGIEEFEPNEELDNFNDRSDDLDLWRTMIDELADRIFWDRDWQIKVHDFESPNDLDESLRLEEYFTNHLPLVSKKQVAVVVAEIENWQLVENE